MKNLDGDAKLVGIDYRPATGDLYGLGDKGGVYVVNNDNGRAMLKSRVNVPLQGTSFGVDFNPVVDRLRIVSDTGQNLADNVDADNDTVTDGTLTNAADPTAGGPRSDRRRRRVHQQRRRSQYRDHAVRHRLGARSDRDPVAAQLGPAGAPRASSWSTRARRSDRTSTARSAAAPRFACRASPP